jgi:hypothetical protein
MSEHAAKNKALAEALGYTVRIANNDPYNTTMPFRCWELVEPDGRVEPCFNLDGSRFYEFYSPDEAWGEVPDFYGSVDALASQLRGKHVVLALDFNDNSAMLTDFERGDGMDNWVFERWDESVEAAAAECVLAWVRQGAQS